MKSDWAKTKTKKTSTKQSSKPKKPRESHNNLTKYICKICGMHFSVEELNRHLYRGVSVQCEYCSESFDATLKLLGHLSTHQNYESPKCTECSRTYRLKILIDWHMNRHSIEMNSNKCDVCNRRFNAKDSFKAHLRTHSETEGKYLLNICIESKNCKQH